MYLDIAKTAIRFVKMILLCLKLKVNLACTQEVP